jgi:hypothetical protein
VSAADTLAADITGVDGFTELKTSANAERGAVYERIMDGTEGSTVDVSFASGAQTAVAIAFVHSGLDWTTYTTDVASAFAASSVDPPQVNLSHGADAIYDVYIFWGGAHGSGQVEVTTPSTGYTELVDENTGPGDTSAGLMVKQITGATSEDPGAYVINTGSTDCVTFAIVAQAATGSVAAGDHTHVEADVTDLAHTDADAIHDNVAGEIAAITAKATPVSADFLVIEDSEASNAKKSITLGDLPATSAALDDLTDVTITGTPADDEVVAYDTGTAEFINQTAAEAGLATSGHVHSADDLSDVDTTTDAPSIGQVLKWDGSNWVPDDDDTGSGSLPTPATKGDLAVWDGDSWEILAAGTDGHAVVADSGEALGLKYASVGGGSGSAGFVELAHEDNRVATPAFVREFKSGESEDSTVVEDTSPNITVTKSLDKLSISHPGGDAARETHGVMWAYAPAGDFWIECAYRMLLQTGTQIMGLYAADGATYGAGTQVFNGANWATGALHLQRYTGYNARVAIVNGFSISDSHHATTIYERMAYNSTTDEWTTWYSPDGTSWLQANQATQALTTSHVGFGVSNDGGSQRHVVSLEYIAAYTGTP